MPTKPGRYPIHQSPFFKLRSRRRLADLLRISPQELHELCDKSGELYREFFIKKKDGGRRDVENPARPLKLVQARISRHLARIQPPDYLFCPVKGRCYVSNAAQHHGNRVVRCLDVKKYFPSTSAKRVYWFFHKVMQCEPDVAASLVKLATYQQHLPTGSPLSPILAYFAHYDVWENVAGICRQHGYTLTVYVDDVTISGQKIEPGVVWAIKRAIHRSGLRYHKEKSFHDRPAEITGVIVKREGLAAPNRQVKKAVVLRADIRRVGKRQEQAEEASKLQLKLGGLQGQIRQIAAQQHAASKR